MSLNEAKGVLSFLRVVGQLKGLLRTGWVNNKVSHPETVASHMHRMGVIAMLVTDPKLNRDKCVKMCIVHDLAEAIVGDITPEEKVTEEEKHEMERNAFVKMVGMLAPPNGESNPELKKVADEIISLWQEYEDQSTPESHLVKDIDKFDMILQADTYEQEQGKDLQGFFTSTAGKFKHPFMKSLVEQLAIERNERLSKK